MTPSMSPSVAVPISLVVRSMAVSASRSEGVGQAGAEQIGAKLVQAVVECRIRAATPVVLLDELVGDVEMQPVAQRRAVADGEFVARPFRQERCHGLDRRRRRVVEVAKAERGPGVASVLETRPNRVAVLVAFVLRAVTGERIRKVDRQLLEPAPYDLLILRQERPLRPDLVRQADRALIGHRDGGRRAARGQRAARYEFRTPEGLNGQGAARYWITRREDAARGDL